MDAKREVPTGNTTCVTVDAFAEPLTLDPKMILVDSEFSGDRYDDKHAGGNRALLKKENNHQHLVLAAPTNDSLRKRG